MHSCAIELSICELIHATSLQVNHFIACLCDIVTVGLLIPTVCCDPTSTVHWGVVLTTTEVLIYARYMKKNLLQYIVCAGDLHDLSCCLVRQQWRLMVMLVISITGIFWSINPEPYLCTGFDCGLCVSTSIIALTKNRSVITASYAPCCTSDCHNHFLVAARNMQYHCHTGSQDFHRMSCHWVDVTSSQSKSQCLLTSFSQTTQVKNCTINMVSYSAACW